MGPQSPCAQGVRGGAGPSASLPLLRDDSHRGRRGASRPTPRRHERDPCHYSDTLLEIDLVLVPRLLERQQVGAEQTDERVVAPLSLRLRAGVLLERGAVRPLRAVDQEVDDRPRGAVGQDRPVSAPQRIARLRGQKGAQGDPLAAGDLLQVVRGDRLIS